MLGILRAGVQPAGRIAQGFPVSRPAVSKHLRLLRQAHLVQERRRGRHRLYGLNPAPLNVVDQWLAQEPISRKDYGSGWEGVLRLLDGYLQKR